MTGPEAAATASPASAVRPGLPRRVLEWFWRGQALRKARRYRRDLPPAERRALERALVAAELAEAARDPIDAPRSGSSLALSLSLNREAAYWALRAHGPELPGQTLGALFDAAPPELLEPAAGGADALSRVRLALVERSFVDTAELPPELLPADAQAARDFVQALLRGKLEPERDVGELLLERSARCLGLLAVLLALVLMGAWWLARHNRTPDLAAGKPWRASSSPDTCHPEVRRCAGVRTDMFFTTSEERDPWVEIDLGKDTAFNSVVVTNRSDCCPDRAAPLIVEVSRDQTNFREVSRRDDTFGVWSTTFAPQTARYVRLRVPRRSILHLDRVAVHNAQ